MVMKPRIIQIVFSCLKKFTEFERNRSGRLQMFFKTVFFLKLCNIQMETSVLESLFDKIAGLQI